MFYLKIIKKFWLIKFYYKTVKVMNGFEKIRPCGIERDEKFTVGFANFLKQQQMQPLITMQQARSSIIQSFQDVFQVIMKADV